MILNVLQNRGKTGPRGFRNVSFAARTSPYQLLSLLEPNASIPSVAEKGAKLGKLPAPVDVLDYFRNDTLQQTNEPKQS